MTKDKTMKYEEYTLRSSFKRMQNYIETFIPEGKSKDTALFDLDMVLNTCLIAIGVEE